MIYLRDKKEIAEKSRQERENQISSQPVKEIKPIEYREDGTIKRGRGRPRKIV